ncbi:MAG: amidohydrolase family protein [Coriobacteriia bacterium]
MRIVDTHTHIFPDDLAPAAIGSLEAEGGIRARYDGTLSGLVSAMDRAGIDVSCIQPVATKPGQVRRINDWVATLAGDRIVPFGTIHPDMPDAPAEVERLAALGLRGIKLHPEYQTFVPDDPRMDALYEAVVGCGLVVLFHAGADINFKTVRGTPEVFARLLDRHPRMRVVLAHMGGYMWWDEVEAHLLGRDVFFDTAYTLGHLPDERFVRMVEAHGSQRVLFGSDGPWTDAAEEVAHIRSLGLSSETCEAVLGGNAERLLGPAAR